MLLADVVRTSALVAAARGRLAKVEALSALLSQAQPDEVPVVVAYLSGELRQRQIGVGHAALAALLREHPSAPGARAAAREDGRHPLTVSDADRVFADVGAVAGVGAQARRRVLLAGLFDRAAPDEREFLARLLAADLRQGALEGVVAEAVARAAGVPAADVRRALLLGGSLQAVARAALGADDASGRREPPAALAALRAFRLVVGRPLRPMLASSAPSVAAALKRVSPAALEWKIDGIRIQVHRSGPAVAVFTRSLDDITARVPEIVAAALALDVRSAVLDGEAVALRPDGRPLPFQVTAGRTGSQADVARQRARTPLTPFFFDLLHLDGADLLDCPADERHALLAGAVPEDLVVPRLVTAAVAAAEDFFADAVAAGHEGVVVKSPSARYAAGRRGGEWVKVKPRHTLDLLVLAAEWGHGRRRGWLSNLHLGALDPAGGEPVMLGKTFKGLTDEMLAWQTRRLLALAEPSRPAPPGGPEAASPAGPSRMEHGVVRVRPELVVEVAFDGVQTSTRYPGGIALRFARVLRHRPDKQAGEADTIDAVRALWPAAAAGGAEPPVPQRAAVTAPPASG